MEQNRIQGLKDLFEAYKATDVHLSKGNLLYEIHATACRDREALRDQKREKERERHRKRNARKLVKLQSIHQYLDEAIGDDVEWKDVALSCEWKDLDSHCNLVEYSCNAVETLVNPFITAPSSFSKKAMQNIVDSVREVFDVLYESDFFSYSHLSIDDKWEVALRQYAVEELPATKFMALDLPDFNLRAPDDVGGGASHMFKHLIKQGEFGEAFALAVCTHQQFILAEVFVRVVHGVEPFSHALFSEEDVRELALACYRAQWDKQT